MKVKYLLEEHPFWKGLGALVLVSTFLAFFEFNKFQILVVDVFLSLVIIIIYFDDRIEIIEKHLRKSKYSPLNMNKKGVTALAMLVVVILIAFLIAYIRIPLTSETALALVNITKNISATIP